jgi:hypothetical protein
MTLELTGKQNFASAAGSKDLGANLDNLRVNISVQG